MIDRARPVGGASRRDFLLGVSTALAGLALGSGDGSRALGRPATGRQDRTDPLFRISLAQWSLHRALEKGELDHLDFPATARREFGLEAVEYVSTFFGGRERDQAYLLNLRDRCDGEGVRSLLIMCDEEGRLGDPDASARAAAVEGHVRWIEAARVLGCHSIRVNAASEGTWDEQRERVVDGLVRLADIADGYGIDVIVENHGGLSSSGRWLASVMEAADHRRVGTLPDFGNFSIGESERYDNYRGMEELMPWARAVSAKSNDFDAAGAETALDFELLVRIVLDAGYRGWIGIEYEGGRLPEPEGIRLTKALLERVREKLAPEYA